MNKQFALVLCAVSLASVLLSACGGEQTTTQSNTETSTSTSTNTEGAGTTTTTQTATSPAE